MAIKEWGGHTKVNGFIRLTRLPPYVCFHQKSDSHSRQLLRQLRMMWGKDTFFFFFSLLVPGLRGTTPGGFFRFHTSESGTRPPYARTGAFEPVLKITDRKRGGRRREGSWGLGWAQTKRKRARKKVLPAEPAPEGK